MKITRYTPPAGDDDPDLGRPFRIEARLRNNRIARAREALGFASVRAAATGLGLPYQQFVRYEALADSPWSTHDGAWKRSAVSIAQALGHEPEDLWPEIIRQVQQRRAVVEIAEPRAYFLDADCGDLARAIDRALTEVPPHAREVVERHFGLRGRAPENVAEIAASLDCSSENVRRYLRKAFMVLAAAPLHQFADSNAPQVRDWKPESATCPSCGRLVPCRDAHKPHEALVNEVSKGKWKFLVRRWVCDVSRRRLHLISQKNSLPLPRYTEIET